MSTKLTPYEAYHAARLTEAMIVNEACRHLACYFDSRVTPLLPARVPVAIPATTKRIPELQPRPAAMVGFTREVTPDDFATFTPVRLKREAEVERLRDELDDARAEIGQLNERISYYEALYESIHFVLVAAGIDDGDLLDMVSEVA